MEEGTEMTEVDGGYDFEFVDGELPHGHTCSICLLAMRNPVQTVCGHRFCEMCLLKSFRRSRKKVCPEDRNPLRGDGGFFPDVAWKRDILSLRVKCKKTDRGCDWIGEIRQYKEHNRVCQYQDVVCDDCEQSMQRRLLGEHQTSECPNRVVQCEYCEKDFAFCRTEIHRGKCRRFPLDCPQLCGVKEIPREEAENHVKEDCLMTMVHCPYEKGGCTFHNKRMHLKAHQKAFIEDHLSKTWSELQKTRGVLKELQDEVDQLQDDNKSLKTSLHRKSNDIKKLEARNKAMNKKLTKLESQLEKVTRTAADNQRIIKLMKPRVLGTNSTSQSKRKRKYSPTESESSSSESESDDESSPRKSKRHRCSSDSSDSDNSDSDSSDSDSSDED